MGWIGKALKVVVIAVAILISPAASNDQIYIDGPGRSI
jgi:hypothetical protein